MSFFLVNEQLKRELPSDLYGTLKGYETWDIHLIPRRFREMLYNVCLKQPVLAEVSKARFMDSELNRVIKETLLVEKVDPRQPKKQDKKPTIIG